MHILILILKNICVYVYMYVHVLCTTGYLTIYHVNMYASCMSMDYMYMYHCTCPEGHTHTLTVQPLEVG